MCFYGFLSVFYGSLSFFYGFLSVCCGFSMGFPWFALRIFRSRNGLN